MAVTFLEYRSNSFCNLCFEERAAINPVSKSRMNTFEFMGEVIALSPPKDISKFYNERH